MNKETIEILEENNKILNLVLNAESFLDPELERITTNQIELNNQLIELLK